MTDDNPDSAYRLVTYQTASGSAVGVLVGDTVFEAEALLAGADTDSSTVLGLLQSWPATLHHLRECNLEQGRVVEDPVLLAPLPLPPAIFCAGANYWDHLEEMEGSVDRNQRAENPWFFVKTSASVVGPGVAVCGPSASKRLDWEAELAVVIATTCRDVDAEYAQEVVAGYTVVNDLSARDLMTRDDRPPSMTFDWVGQKCFDGSLPMGPWLTPAAAVPDPHSLEIRLWVNDRLEQESNTANMVHNIWEQIDWLSHQLTLRPGDVICTGTPAGVGMPRGVYLEPGDTVRVEIEGLGTLVTPIIRTSTAGAPELP